MLRLLGINTDFMFRQSYLWNMQKGLQTLSSPSMLWKVFNKQGNMAIYSSFIKSNFSFCPIVQGMDWSLFTMKLLEYGSLPNNLRQLEAYPQFRRLLHSWEFPSCSLYVDVLIHDATRNAPFVNFMFSSLGSIQVPILWSFSIP